MYLSDGVVQTVGQNPYLYPIANLASRIKTACLLIVRTETELDNSLRIRYANSPIPDEQESTKYFSCPFLARLDCQWLRSFGGHQYVRTTRSR